MNANEKLIDAIGARLRGECRYDSSWSALYCAECRRDIIATALAAAERRGEDRVLRWIARFGGNYIPGGGFTSMIEAYRKARRRARGSRS